MIPRKVNKLLDYKNLYNYSWRELAQKIGITVSSLHGIANGTVKDIKISTANKIKKVTGLEPKDYISK